MRKHFLKWPISLRCFCFLLLLQFLLCCSASKEEKEVIECYKKYNAARLNDMGEEATECLDSETVDYYQDVLDKAIYADKEAIMKENIINRLMVFQIRHQIPLEDLIKMDGTKLLVYSINSGWTGKSDVALEVKNAKIFGDFATADVYKHNKNTGIKCQFYYEDNQWKYNLVSSMQLVNAFIKQQVKEARYSNEDDFLFFVLEGESGKEVTKDLYEPLIEKKE